jgi:hypothetical protein
MMQRSACARQTHGPAAPAPARGVELPLQLVVVVVEERPVIAKHGVRVGLCDGAGRHRSAARGKERSDACAGRGTGGRRWHGGCSTSVARARAASQRREAHHDGEPG